MTTLSFISNVGPATLLAAVGFILAVALSVLLFVAPLGIWNRLIKIHRDQEAAAKANADRLDKLINLAAQLVAIERGRQ